MGHGFVHRYSHKRRVLVLAAAGGLAALAGCSSAPKPLAVKITLEGSANLNPDQRGRPSPASVKLFALKSVAVFEKADFFSLFDRERETLGDDLVGRDELILKPGERVVLDRKLPPEVAFVGVMVGYRDLERAKWRLSIPVAQLRRPVTIQVDALNVSLK
jgi:type VI secretion system protein VasD